MPVIHGLPVPEPLWQIAPRAPRPGAEENPVNHRPVITPPAAPRRISGQEPPQALPFLISQVMAFQSVKHRTDLHDPDTKIHGTRPSGASPQPGEACPAGWCERKGLRPDRCGGTLCPGMGRLLAVGGLAACPTGACHDATAHRGRCPF